MAGRQVFAHYMVGLTDGQSSDQWSKDINDAKAVGIDGFALNIGPSDSWTLPQLRLAYAAAEAAGSFSLFPSFDMACCGDWGVDAVVGIVNEFKGSSAHTKVDNRPMVSTFEGPNWATNWPGVRDATGGIYLVPDWSSQGPDGVASRLDLIDGHFSWNAWPKAGQSDMSPAEDIRYQEVLGGKSYMMGISPWFYTNLPQWSKNWYFASDSLWFDRWQQAIDDVLPDFIQIITWNDFGESSYISDHGSGQVVSGAEKYVDGFDHSALRAVLPYFIAAYKAGTSAIPPPSDEAIAWYRTTPAKAGSDGGTIWGQSGSLSASDATEDVVNILTITVDETDIEVIIGGESQTFRTGGGGSPASFFQVPYGGLGEVTLNMNGRSVVGPAITAGVPATGYVNFNALAIAL